MNEIFKPLTASQRLLFNSLCFISNYIIRAIHFIYVQISYIIKYNILKLPSPKVEQQKTIYTELLQQNKLRKLTEHQQPMSELMIRQRKYCITEIISIENHHGEMLQSFSDYYREGMKKLLKEDLYHQIFDKLDDLIETNLRIRLLLKEEYDKKGHNAPIGQIFLDLSSDFNNLQYSVDNFLSISTSFQTEYYGNKSFRKRVKSLQRRSNNRFMKYIKLPLEGIVNYVQKLTEISKVTPNWHPDYEPINSVLKILTPVSIKAEQNLKEEKRRITLIKIQRKIKGAPNLADDVNCTFVGKWKLMKDKMFIFVFSDLIIIVQEKTELLSRRQYYAIAKQIEVKSIGEVKMEKSGIVLKIKSRKIEIKVQMKKKELYDAIMQQKLKVQTVE